MRRFIKIAQNIRALRPSVKTKPAEAPVPILADCPPQMQAAMSKSISDIIEGENENIKDAPDLEQVIYTATLRANIDSSQSDEKYTRWARYKSGIGHMESAKYERPDWAAQAEKGNKQAHEFLVLLSDAIRRQVTRFDKRIAKQQATE
jgi:hypothetical protein